MYGFSGNMWLLQSIYKTFDGPVYDFWRNRYGPTQFA